MCRYMYFFFHRGSGIYLLTIVFTTLRCDAKTSRTMYNENLSNQKDPDYISQAFLPPPLLDPSFHHTTHPKFSPTTKTPFQVLFYSSIPFSPLPQSLPLLDELVLGMRVKAGMARSGGVSRWIERGEERVGTMYACMGGGLEG